MTSDEYKLLGDNAFRSGNSKKAILFYTKAINLVLEDDKRAVLYSNRSAAHLKEGNAHGALEDANSCVQVDPLFAKGYCRKGAALFQLKQYQASITAYKEGLERFPGDESIRKGLDSVMLASEGIIRENLQDDDKVEFVAVEKPVETKQVSKSSQQKTEKRRKNLLDFGRSALKDFGSGILAAGKAVESGVKGEFEFKGEITLDFETKVYNQGEKLEGKVILNLIEDMQANGVTVSLQVTRKQIKREDDDLISLFDGAHEEIIFAEEYEISGKRKYRANEEIQFELIIPMIIKKSSSESGAFLQTLGDAMLDRDISVHPMWSIDSEIHQPGGCLLSLSSNSYRLHVNDD